MRMQGTLAPWFPMDGEVFADVGRQPCRRPVRRLRVQSARFGTAPATGVVPDVSHKWTGSPVRAVRPCGRIPTKANLPLHHRMTQELP